MITGDARMTVDFYADVLGLRLVKKTVNFDDPSAYHLYFGDEDGAPGSILTWFDFAGVGRGRAGAGMIHRIQFGVADERFARLLGGPAPGQGIRQHAAGTSRCSSRTSKASTSSWCSPTPATPRSARPTPRCPRSTRSSASRAPGRTPTGRGRRRRC